MELPWEDNLLERKTEGDLKDLPKTMVAFANSVMPDHIATILIGERDDGKSAPGVKNPENIQQTVRKEAERIYPPIIWKSTVYEKDGKPCVRVDIEPSGNAPHFGGISWVRSGSSTITAPDEMFQKLIELRTAKVREISKWIGKMVTVRFDIASLNVPYGTWTSMPQTFGVRWNYGNGDTAKVVQVNGFWVELDTLSAKHSEPLDKILLSFDRDNNRLLLIVRA